MTKNLEALSALATRVATDYDANLKAAAREKEAAVEALKRVVEAVGTALPAISAPITVEQDASGSVFEPKRRTNGRGVHLIGRGPEVEMSADGMRIGGEDLFLDDAGSFLLLRYRPRSKRGLGVSDWSASAETLTPVQVVEKFGAQTVPKITEELTATLQRHDRGGRSKRTERYDATTAMLEAVTLLVARAFSK